MWLLILSFCVCLTTITSLMFCLCWRKKPPKDDLLGLHGMVTQKNPDENVNHLSSVNAPCVVDGGNITATSVELIDANKRIITTTAAATTTTTSTTVTTVTATNTRRSLPDIPSEQIDNAPINWEPGDNSSEHYATVGQYQNNNNNNNNNLKRHTIPNGIEQRPSISQHSSISQADDAFSPYEKVKYDKIKKQEHPYAQLQPTTTISTTIPTTTTTTTTTATISTTRQILEEHTDERTTLLNNEPLVPTRSRRSSSSHSGLGVDITAATAVAGGIAASPELPYMTPPVAQTNFSGDSQDSSKGYTSISVREPLANIIAQTKEMNKKRELDPHYSTVSDDSDDVYTTIPDPNNQIYTSESETYARIPPLPITVEAEVNPTPIRCLNNESNPNDEFYEPAPQPPLPSVDSLKQVTNYSHSRQASSSSSVANIGSPKPEKRQANSPLPPPPPPPPTGSRAGSSSSLSFDFHIDKIQSYRNIDDLYAKVHKNKRKDETDDNEKSPDKNRKTYDNFNRKSLTSSIGSNDNSHDNNSRKCKEHNYETLRKNDKLSSNNNNNNNDGYEKIKHEEPGYASINGPDSITSSDPGYEVLKQRPTSEIYPNYEELQHNVKTTTTIDGYSVVNKKNKIDDKSSSYNSNSQDLSIDEPNYESMPSETVSEHNYAALKSNNSDTDPNYESVNSDRNSYEKLKKPSDDEDNNDDDDDDDDDDENGDEPPYERLDDDSSRTNTESLSGYEKINHRYQSTDISESSSGDKRKSDPPYERLVNDNGDCDVPGYEKVNFSETSNNNCSKKNNNNNNNNNNEPNYATIKDDNNLLEENAIFQV